MTHPSPDPSGAESLFARAIHADRYLLRSELMGHVDFTSYALIEDRSAIIGQWAAGTPEMASAHRAFARYVYHFFSAFLGENSESLAVLSNGSVESLPEANMTLEHRAATPAVPGYDELVQKIVSGQASDAVDELRSLAAAQPSHDLLDEVYLWRLAFSLLTTWELAEEAIPLMELMVELYPSSGNALVLLGEGYILLESYPAAIDVYNRLLEHQPQNAWGKSRLEWLRSQ